MLFEDVIRDDEHCGWVEFAESFQAQLPVSKGHGTRE